MNRITIWTDEKSRSERNCRTNDDAVNTLDWFKQEALFFESHLMAFVRIMLFLWFVLDALNKNNTYDYYLLERYSSYDFYWKKISTLSLETLTCTSQVAIATICSLMVSQSLVRGFVSRGIVLGSITNSNLDILIYNSTDSKFSHSAFRVHSYILRLR